MTHNPNYNRVFCFILCFVFLRGGYLSATQLEAAREKAAELFDGLHASVSAAANLPAKTAFGRLLENKEILSAGHWNGSVPALRPFKFKNAKEGWTAEAQNPGLEGFLWTKRELEGKYGEGLFIQHLNDYFNYLDTLLSSVSWTSDFRNSLAVLKNANIQPLEKNARLNELLAKYVADRQAELKAQDAAGWVKTAKIYELFPRAYNTDGRRAASDFKLTGESVRTLFFRNFQSRDFEVIKRMGFDTIWPMGVLPIGVRGQTGTGGGSPYSISDHGTVNPDLGTEEEFRAFVSKAHAAGLKVIVDFVVNHTSLDSKLLAENPDYFISYRSNAACPAADSFDYQSQNVKYCVRYGGMQYGDGIASWIDTAQVNYSDANLQARMIELVKGWVTKFDIDGYRVDMAYLALNNVFAKTWQRQMPAEEFYRRLISTVKAVKPGAAFLAEAYAYQEDLSACGFDAIYSKHETARPEGQTGWYNAMEAGNPYEFRSAINRAAFLAWQKGGSGAVVFTGNHDEAAPEKTYGRRLPAALILSFLYPGAVLMYSGAEIGYDAAIPGGEQKPLPFSVPAKIDWNAGSPWVKQIYQKILSESAAIRRELGEYEISPLWPLDGGRWAGYTLLSKTYPGVKKAIIANVSLGGTQAFVPEFGFNAWLEPGDYRVLSVK